MQASERNKRKERIGIVTSDKMEKTIAVQVTREMRHPMYTKMIQSKKKFMAHDEKEEANIGDMVRIEEVRPLSKTKRWRLVEILVKAGTDAKEQEKS